MNFIIVFFVGKERMENFEKKVFSYMERDND